MRFFKNGLKFAALVTSGVLLFPRHAYGYIDPGTGSYVFQIIIAAFVAVSFAVKIFWHKIKGFFSRLFSRKER